MTERVGSGRTLSVSLRSTALPKGEPLAKRTSFVLTGHWPEESNLVSSKPSASAKASPFRERWHGEAVTERVSSGTNPLSLAALDSSPEGRALGKEDEFRPHRSTAGRSQLISAKLYALAKASPFRERWHGRAVTERVAFRTNPFRHFALRNATSPEGGALGKEGEFCPHRSTTRRS